MVRSISLIAYILFILAHGSDVCERSHKIFQVDEKICMILHKLRSQEAAGSAKELMNNITEYNDMVMEQVRRFRDNKVTCIPFVHDFFQNHGSSFRKVFVYKEFFERVFQWRRHQFQQYKQLLDKTDELWLSFKTLYFQKVIDKLQL